MLLTTRLVRNALLQRRNLGPNRVRNLGHSRCIIRYTLGSAISIDEAAYIDLIQKTIEEKGGEIRASSLGSIPKPNSVSVRPMEAIKRNPDRFKVRKDGSSTWVSLSENSKSLLSKCDSKENKDVTPYVFVETALQLTEALHNLAAEKQCLTPDGKTIFAVDLEGNNVVETIQIATDRSVIIVDCRAIGREKIGSALADILSSDQCVKLMHDVRQDSILLLECGLKLNGILDTQLVAEAAFGLPFIGLNPFLERIDLPTNPEKRKMGHQMNVENRDPFEHRPIQHEDLLYAAYDVSCLIQSKAYIWSKFQNSSIEKLMVASSLRVKDALQYGARRPICFDRKNNFRMCSSAIFRALDGANAYFGDPTKIVTNLDNVVSLLPHDIGESLRDDAFLKENVSDIVLDLGRRPQCMIPGERRDLHSRGIASKDIEEIVSKLESGFGRDGRAAMPGSLNRVSAMRGKAGEILGITIRIGRTIQNRADLLFDFLLGTEKSVLILGKPASGKTSVLRDVARNLSSTRNVVVIDKSNEIAGEGHLPHESIASSRRMMVPNGKSQQDVMIECVENHAPEVIVIDEIGNQKQVAAARTAKDRGVRMIATAHGDLCGLIDNQMLNGLVGGIDTVPITDEAASVEHDRRIRYQGASQRGFFCQRRQSPPKLKTQRVSQPVFDVIVEVMSCDRNSLKVIPDSARAVDEVLAGIPYHAHVRSKDPDTGTMFYEFAEDFFDRTRTAAAWEVGIDLEEKDVEPEAHIALHSYQ
jgi:stage III sporulation protein SpoIIIAA